jgi:hypothetical protein
MENIRSFMPQDLNIGDIIRMIDKKYKVVEK